MHVALLNSTLCRWKSATSEYAWRLIPRLPLHVHQAIAQAAERPLSAEHSHDFWDAGTRLLVSRLSHTATHLASRQSMTHRQHEVTLALHAQFGHCGIENFPAEVCVEL